MDFTRLGGLSAVKYNKLAHNEPFHRPPKKAGVYAFIWPYIDQFLCLWDEDHTRELKNHGFRRFKYDGQIWCHISGYIEVGSWFLTTTDQLELDLKKFKHDDIVELQKNHPLFTEKLVRTCDDPYKKGRNGFMTKDILEVFIEKKNLGKIR